MKTRLLHVRRLTVAAALLGVVFPPRVASAQSDLDVSEAQAFLGTWDLTLDTEFGSFDMEIKIEDEGGKVAVTIGAVDLGLMQDVSDVKRSGESLVLSYEADAQGQMIPVSVSLVPDGEGLAADFDFGGQFYMSGIATRAEG